MAEPMNSDFKDLLRAFNAHQVEYLIVGGYAFMHYAEPRYTKDLDIWVWANAENAVRVFTALRDFGAPVSEMTVEDFAVEGYVFQIGISPVRIDILMSVDGVKFEEAWNNRSQVMVGNDPVWMISKADLIVNKRASARPQDILDADALEATDR
jgi:hypothetical protein